MFYVIDKEDKLSIFDDNKEKLENTRKIMPQLDGQYTIETDIITATELGPHPEKVIVGDVDIEIDVPDYDEEGNPIMIEVEEEITVPDYDEEGNPIGEHTETVTKLVPKTHKETITVKGLVLNPEFPAIELEKVKAAKIAENDRVRDIAIDGGVTYQDILFDSDTDQKVNILATVQEMKSTDSIVWFGMNNESLNCSKADLKAIGALITELHTFCWTKNAEIKAAISEAETVEEVEAIEIDYTLE